MRKTRRSFSAIAEEVRTLHDLDEQLSKAQEKNLAKQRDARLRVGRLVAQVDRSKLDELAWRSGYTRARLGDFRRVSEAWPEGSFPPDAHFTALEELARFPNRFELIRSGVSKRDMREAAGGRVDTPSRWSPKVKADFIKEALNDPTVAREVASDMNSRSSIARAEQAAFQEDRDRRDLDPTHKASRQTVSGDDVIRQIVNARYMVNRALDQAMNDGLTDAKRREALEAARELRISVDWMTSFLQGGDTSFEQALDDLLRSQEN